MNHIRAVVNQCGVAMELHGHTTEPVTVALVSFGELGAYRAELAKSNPDFRHAVIGQLAVMYAKRIFQNIAVSERAWTYNASANTYAAGKLIPATGARLRGSCCIPRTHPKTGACVRRSRGRERGRCRAPSTESTP